MLYQPSKVTRFFFLFGGRGGGTFDLISTKLIFFSLKDFQVYENDVY